MNPHALVRFREHCARDDSLTPGTSRILRVYWQFPRISTRNVTHMKHAERTQNRSDGPSFTFQRSSPCVRFQPLLSSWLHFELLLASGLTAACWCGFSAKNRSHKEAAAKRGGPWLERGAACSTRRSPPTRIRTGIGSTWSSRSFWSSTCCSWRTGRTCITIWTGRAPRLH